MREAIGSSLLLNIALVFISVISLFLVGSIAYSKAFKAKNQIISVIESYDGVCFQGSDLSTENCFNEIESKLTDMGYSSNISSSCPDLVAPQGSGIESIKRVYPTSVDFSTDIGHHYCVYKYTLCETRRFDSNNDVCSGDSNKMHYYKVITFMHFDIPLIGQFLEFEVSGETKTFYETFINIKENI